MRLIRQHAMPRIRLTSRAAGSHGDAARFTSCSLDATTAGTWPKAWKPQGAARRQLSPRWRCRI